MKITNVYTDTIYLDDLRLAPEGQTVGRRGEDAYLGPGHSIYVPDTGEVLRSAYKGDLRHWRELGVIELDDQVTLNSGASVTISHNLGYLPRVAVMKQVGATWVDATGTFDLVHDQNFTQTTITNTTAVALTVLIRVG